MSTSLSRRKIFPETMVARCRQIVPVYTVKCKKCVCHYAFWLHIKHSKNNHHYNARNACCVITAVKGGLPLRTRCVCRHYTGTDYLTFPPRKKKKNDTTPICSGTVRILDVQHLITSGETYYPGNITVEILRCLGLQRNLYLFEKWSLESIH